jgi:uncharacterized membrane protein
VNSATKSQPQTVLILWTLIVIYAAARVLQVFPGKIPLLAIVALHVLAPMTFAVIHGAMLYRLRGMVTFIAICLFVGNIFENLGVRTGFPFRHYYFTDVMGPKIFAVPIFLGLAYVGMAYLSWTLGALILGGPGTPLCGHRVVTLPLVASFIVVAWDLSMDPVWSTIMHAWIWRDGGAYFGVPITNFLGWYLTVFVIYQCFALYLYARAIPVNLLPPSYWPLAVLFYAVSAAGNLLVAIPAADVSMVSDASGAQWKVSSIVSASVLTSIFAMGTFALIAWARIPDGKPTSWHS